MTARQDILDHLQEKLGAIVGLEDKVFQPSQEGVDMAAQPAAFLAWTEDRAEYGPANGRFKRFLQVLVVLVCQEGVAGLSATVDALLAEVEKVCMADPTQGGHAYETANLSSALRPFIEGYPDAVAAVSFEVRYFVTALGVP